ncbi:hypothetical protein JCM11641_003017 [Rhodosporidiobolus odoratus]
MASCPFSGSTTSDDPACPFSSSSASSSDDDLSPSTPPEQSHVPSFVSQADRKALHKRVEQEVTKGVLVQDDAAATLYLPPLLSLLPESLSPASSPLSSGTSTPCSSSPTPSPALYTLSRLPDIDPVSLALHTALHHFRPVTPHYATAPYASAFNWSELILEDADGVREAEREFYCVVFRSRRKKGLGEEEATELYRKDRAAHEEAVTHGGLISYWFGNPVPPSSSTSAPAAAASVSTKGAEEQDDLVGRNLATCIWMSRASALNALKGEKHKEAARLAVRSYEYYTLERYILRKEVGELSVRVVPWHGREMAGA